ncbi:hypothetical protein PR048_002568 [Dryococelus australis]|uniref:Uncharacterized protein n=1 Tax=Dryococelus australis TaxID=614101 RepID=A0ABQ9IKP2_9NEOP|nr:hypothetical protein PR048_002568 [Dryococelus australis]
MPICSICETSQQHSLGELKEYVINSITTDTKELTDKIGVTPEIEKEIQVRKINVEVQFFYESKDDPI